MTSGASLRVADVQDKYGEASLMTSNASLRMTEDQDKYGETSLMTGEHAPEAAFQACGASAREGLLLGNGRSACPTRRQSASGE